MKSKRNLTRFTYENTAFQGWRLCLTRGGSNFTKYFSDKAYGSEKKSLAAAEATLEEVKATIDKSRMKLGKLNQTTVKKIRKILASA